MRFKDLCCSSRETLRPCLEILAGECRYTEEKHAALGGTREER